MSCEVEEGEEFSVKGFLHWPIDEILYNNGLQMRNGANFYMRVASDGNGKGYFYISGESNPREPRIEDFDKFMRTVPLILSDPSAGGMYNSRSRISFEDFIYNLMCENNGRLNGGIWPLASGRLLICTNKLPLELKFQENGKNKGHKPYLVESYALMEAICPRKEQINKATPGRKAKLGSNLPRAVKEVYSQDPLDKDKIEQFGSWYGRAFPMYTNAIRSYRR